MLGLLRLLAILTMLLAAVSGILVFPDVWHDFMGRGEEVGKSGYREDLHSDTNSSMQAACWRLYRPASLFCLSAVLFVLIRIARAQDEEVPVVDPPTVAARPVPLALPVNPEKSRVADPEPSEPFWLQDR
jgi:hypothetical protein